MSIRRWLQLRVWFSWLTVITITLPPQLLVAAPPQAAFVPSSVSRVATLVPDIALQAGGTLDGQILDANGVPLAAAVVQLTSGPRIWKTRTDADGVFHLTDLCGGTYQITAAGQSQLLRTWAPGTAPPKANRGVLITPAADVVRGQRVLSPNTNQFFRVAKNKLTNPWIVAGTVVAVAAIPVALHNIDDDDPAPATP